MPGIFKEHPESQNGEKCEKKVEQQQKASEIGGGGKNHRAILVHSEDLGFYSWIKSKWRIKKGM
jgi:hypothetical protein